MARKCQPYLLSSAESGVFCDAYCSSSCCIGKKSGLRTSDLRNDLELNVKI